MLIVIDKSPDTTHRFHTISHDLSHRIMYVKLLAIQLFPLMEPEVSKCNLSNLNLRASETDVIDDWLKENIKV